MRKSISGWIVLTACSTLIAPACASSMEHAAAALRAADPADPAVAGALVIEQFLRAANTKDYGTMSRLFGTKQGPIVDLYDRRHVDQRMLVLAVLLEHENHALQDVAPVPGRGEGARQVIVRMTLRGRETEVPYTIVRSDAGSWLVEQVDLERITGR